MPFRFLLGRGDDRLQGIESKTNDMIEDGRYSVDLALAALIGDRTWEEVQEEIRTTDRHINEMEREIRRELVVVSSVGGGIDLPSILILFSVVKDVERIGDYAKNLLDLCRDGANFRGIPDEAHWRELAADVGRMIASTAEAFTARDAVSSTELVVEGRRLLRIFDERVSRLVAGEDREREAVARALAYRYLKRVVAHLLNILSAVVVPIDRLNHLGRAGDVNLFE